MLPLILFIIIFNPFQGVVLIDGADYSVNSLVHTISILRNLFYTAEVRTALRRRKR